MLVQVVTLFVAGLGIYAAIGILFAFYFVSLGCGKLDPMAKQGTIGFRILIFPASAALWPLLALRLARGRQTPPIERNAHRDAAGGGA
ncbi:hypothetical protein SCOR_28270 [Sulfidibacter corallicola]|uniref:Uncharacterized protein n=1 Tax=Sulfidibacter corallicola TaxID=2818388 RepID=A0A8A4TM54_SULCO|nr:hypothetical protein [Sulfidibacter corallicola]QTD50547.1 hypothetical protein J3U87_33605 [Sulfidibacter corallicola]